MKLDPKRIRIDGGTQPRAALLIDVMEDYAEQMRNGVEFPPITVFFDGKEYWLADGFHRLGAALRVRPDDPIEAEVIQGTQSEAQWYSYGVNKAHGLRRKPEDKERAVKAALRHPNGEKRSDRQVAEHVGVDHKTVAKYRAELHSRGEIPHVASRVGRDGKNYPSGRARVGGANRQPATGRQRTKHSRTRLTIHNPTRAPNPVEKMTALSMPHNPVMGARTLIELFDADYLRALVQKISSYLKGLET